MTELTTSVTRKLNFFNNSKVDIIIPFHGTYDKVSNAIASIFKFTKNIKYNLVLIDDASENKHFGESLSSYNINLIRNEKQLGFGASLMEGYKNTLNPWILCMHSDCEVTNINWLTNLGEFINKYKKMGVKMVAPKTNNPVSGDPRAKQENYYNSEDILLEDDILEKDCYLGMYCFLFHRDLIRRCGEIKNYPYCGYENLEYAFRMRKRGFLQALCGSSWIMHHGGATTSKLSKNDDILDKMNKNRELCIADLR